MKSLGSKIKGLAELKTIILKLKKGGKRIVFTNGCFDLLHFGHVLYLQEAKLQGDILIVGINSDVSVKRIKGKNRPIVPQFDRLRTIAGLQSVDYVLLFNDNTPLRLIKALKPAVLVKGADWKKKDIVGSDVVNHYGGKVATIKLARSRSTTRLIEKIVALHSY